ncbi:hypothetical protein HY642_03290 [Candidatus Woesearchaeota archaeon]|nr:hypothetical protein [Candidatus Woesearchaeota archaeon]
MALEQVELAFDSGSKQRLIRGLLIAARKELVEYKTRKDLVKLVQSAEKVWVAFVNLLEIRLGRDIPSHHGVINSAMQLARKEPHYQQMLDWGEDLHVFHYAPRMYVERVQREIIHLSKEIREELASVRN